VIRYGIVAAPRQGKTTAILQLARSLAGAGVTCTGVAQPACLQDGRVVGYALQDIPGGEQQPFATRRPAGPPPRSASHLPPGRPPDHGFPEPAALAFRFDDTGLSWAAARIQRRADVLLVDELGWLEAAGKGHLPAVQAAQRHGLHQAAVLAVRQDALPAVQSRLGRLRRFPAPSSTMPEIERALLGALTRQTI
jgi:nucleoside-triphosphatase THEP1